MHQFFSFKSIIARVSAQICVRSYLSSGPSALVALGGREVRPAIVALGGRAQAEARLGTGVAFQRQPAQAQARELRPSPGRSAIRHGGCPPTPASPGPSAHAEPRTVSAHRVRSLWKILLIYMRDLRLLRPEVRSSRRHPTTRAKGSSFAVAATCPVAITRSWSS